MRRMYEMWYRHGTPPWVIGPRKELVELVETGQLAPCRVVDLGCGVGDNAIFLARHGFDVTGIDYARPAIEKARLAAARAGVAVRFEVDDLTNLQGHYGTFDLLVDYGTLDDLSAKARRRYLDNVIPLASPGARFLLWCFEWQHSRMDKFLGAALPFGNVSLQPGDVDRDFGEAFAIECIARDSDPPGWPRGTAAYLMTRHVEGESFRLDPRRATRTAAPQERA